MRTACFKASIEVTLSPLNRFGLKNGIVAPKFLEIFAISLLSVDTISSSMYLDFFAAYIE